MPFNFITYKKIKDNYSRNIDVFKNIGNNKISFVENTGRFRAEGGFLRTISTNTEGTSAINEDGFNFPIIALCYAACRKGIKDSQSRGKYKEDIDTIIKALETLGGTYSSQQQGLFKKNKTQQIANVNSTRGVCEFFRDKLQLVSDNNQQEIYRDVNTKFAEATKYKSTSNFVGIISGLRALPDGRDARDISTWLAAAKEPNYSEIKSLKSLRHPDTDVDVYNPEFIKLAAQLGDKIYELQYAKSEKINNYVDAKRYRETLNAIVKQVRNSNFSDGKYQYLDDEYKERPAALQKVTKEDYEEKYHKGDFLYFRGMAPSRFPVDQAQCRLYLNVSPNLNAHTTVVRELVTEISKSDWDKKIADFKFTHFETYRFDTVCIYGSSVSEMTKLGRVLSSNRSLTSQLRPQVANMQRQLAPGIAIGVEPENVFIKPSSRDGKGWSFGSHRSFLVAWGMLIASKEGVKLSDSDFVEKTLFHVNKVFADNGIELQKSHKIYENFDKTPVGTYLNLINAHGLKSLYLIKRP